ncbi:MAG: type II secretion system minor pseudopilin GspI [Syntrophobacterales bacterium]|nr:type II secretion system minor pseudopilin GspI [Syntrophobacterales bacterium]
MKQNVSNHISSNSDIEGFTLLEVMIAMAILATTLVVVFQSQSQSISMAGRARFETTASLLAQSRMAEIEAANPENVVSDSGDFGDDFPDYSWQVDVTETELESLKKIEVKVVNEKMTSNNSFRLVLYRFFNRDSALF